MDIRFPSFYFPIFHPKTNSDKQKMIRHILHNLITIGICCSVLIGCYSLTGSRTKEQVPVDDQSILKDIISELRTRYDLVETLKTQMNVTIKTKGEKPQEVREYLFYKRPDKLKINALGPLNETRVVVLAVEESFTMFFVQEKQAIQGPLTDTVLTKVFNIDMRVSDVRSAIFANPFLDGNTTDIQIARAGNAYVVRRPSLREGHTEEITLSQTKDAEFIVTDWKFQDAGGNIIQHTEFDDYREIGGILRPLKVTISRTVEGTKIVFSSVKPEINKEISDTAFRLKLPKGTEVQILNDTETDAEGKTTD